MIIKVTNPINKLSLSFFQLSDWKRKYRFSDWDIASLNGDYQILRDGSDLASLFALPEHANYFVQGLNENGSTFQSDNYENRKIIFRFRQVQGANMLRQSQVLFQDDHMLDIEIIVGVNTFTTQGALVGSYSNGVIELECPDPFFNIKGDSITINKTILWNVEGDPMLPLTLPDIPLNNINEEYNQIIYDSVFQSVPVMELTGTFDWVSIVSLSTGTAFTVPYNVRGETLKIDSIEGSVYIDDIDITDDSSGIFPIINGGINIFEFYFKGRIDDVEVKLVFNQRAGVIYG